MARRKAEELCKASLVILETRKKHKVTVEAFAKSLGMSAIWYQKIRTGEIIEPSYGVLSRLIKNYRVRPKDLF